MRLGKTVAVLCLLGLPACRVPETVARGGEEPTDSAPAEMSAAPTAAAEVDHVVAVREALSRGHRYICFARNNAPYEVTEEVGGEYVSTTHLIAFSGDRFRLAVSPQNETVQWHVTGAGTTVTDTGAYTREVWVQDADETFVHIALMAHPSETVTLTVTPLPSEAP